MTKKQVEKWIFTWDENKSERNRTERGFGFDLARLVFYDPNVYYREDRADENGECREHAIGFIEEIGIVLVGFTERVRTEEDEQQITQLHEFRIFTARLAERYEQQDYYEAF